MQKILYILRHAKAREGEAGQDDHERTLNERGRNAAAHMGKFLAKRKIWPDKVLCSSAMRTAETLMKIEEAYKRPLPVEYSEALYLASGNEILNLLARLSDNIASVMLVGHNPGLHQLAVKLARTGDEALLKQLSEKFPTGAFAEIDLGDIAWRMLPRARGKLARFMTPKDLEE